MAQQVADVMGESRTATDISSEEAGDLDESDESDVTSDTETSERTQSSLTEHETPTVSSDGGVVAASGQSRSVFSLPSTVNLSILEMSEGELNEAMTQPYEEAHDLIESPPDAEPVFSGALSYQQLYVLTKHLIGVADESRVAITEDGWYISVTDPANVAMVTAWLPAGDWDEYVCEQEGVIGLSWTGSGASVSGALKHFEKGTSIEIEYEDRTATFNDGIPIEFSSIDPSAVRKPIKVPDQILPNSFTLPGVDVDELTKRMDDISDHMAVEGQPQNNSVELRAEGDTAVVRKEYAEFDDITVFDGSRKNDVFATYVSRDDCSLFSLDYIRDFISKPRKADLKTGYRFSFSEETMMKVQRDLGDNGFLRYLQSPRIES